MRNIEKGKRGGWEGGGGMPGGMSSDENGEGWGVGRRGWSV